MLKEFFWNLSSYCWVLYWNWKWCSKYQSKECNNFL